MREDSGGGGGEKEGMGGGGGTREINTFTTSVNNYIKVPSRTKEGHL